MYNVEFANKARIIARKRSTIYARGASGEPMTDDNKYRFFKGYDLRGKRGKHISRIRKQTFAFSDVGLIAAILNEWEGDCTKDDGGRQNVVPEVYNMTAEELIGACSGVTDDFYNLKVGELLWTEGHVGIYIGDGFAVECTQAWNDGVQVTTVSNVVYEATGNARIWKKHGMLPWIGYIALVMKSHDALYEEIIRGRWGCGDENIRQRLRREGYNDGLVINYLHKRVKNSMPLRPLRDIAEEVMSGDWGESIREQNDRLTVAGYNYLSVRTVMSKMRSEDRKCLGIS